MKKYIVFLLTGLLFTFSGCDKDTDPGGTAVMKMAGDWWVTTEQSVEEYDAIFGTGTMPDEANVENWTWDDIYGSEHTMIYTYNTAANIPTEMFLEDGETFWGYKIKVKTDYNARTFECPSTVNMWDDDCNVTIIKGKILEGAATTPSGMPADSIIFYVKFSDDEYGFTYQKVSGFRRTGFEEDDFH